MWRYLAICAAVTAGTAQAEPIHLAARKGDVAKIEALLAEGVPVEQPSTKNTTYTGVTPLYVAAKFGRLEAVELLLSRGADPALATISTGSNGAPMHVAAQWGREEIVARFLEAGVDPNLPDAWVGPPLHLALLSGHDNIAQMLLSYGAIPSVRRDPITDLLAGADPAAGEKVFRRCVICHEIHRPENMGDSTAVSLWNIVGRPKAAQDGFSYSKAIKEFGGVWDYDELNSFLADPMAFIPGTGMNYRAGA